jgi:3-hydroxybutyryl-CoA dehydrogenase
VEKTGSQDAGSQEGRREVDRQKVGVLGAGTMGSGISITVARVGHPVVIRDVSQDRVEAGLASVRKFLDRGVERGRMSEEQRDTAV